MTNEAKNTGNGNQVNGGSEVVRALENAWAAIQANHPDLPDAVLITGSGAAGGEWGHTWADRWVEGSLPTDTELEQGGAVAVATSTRKTEIFIAGERLACGAKLTFQTMLHEAAHVLAHVRGEKDTSNKGRYHNKVFVKICGELGLVWPEGEKAHATIGFSAVVITDETAAKYADVIDGLQGAIKLYLALPWFMGGQRPTGTGTEGGDDEGGTVVVIPPRIPRGRPKTKPGTGSNNLPMAICGCRDDKDQPSRKIRLSKKALALGGITCKVCGEDFAVPAEEEDQADED